MCINNNFYIVIQKQGVTLTMAINQILIDLLNSFTAAKSTKFPTKPILVYLLIVEQKTSNVCTSRLHFCLHCSKL